MTALALAVLQLALALHVRNTVLDAAAEGARHASLADTRLADGVERTRDLIEAAIGPGYTNDVTARHVDYAGVPAIEVRVRTRMPLAGLIGPDGSLEVRGHAALERDD